MFLNQYLFGVALLANILLNVTSLDYICVSDSYGTFLDTSQVVELQVATPPNIVNVPQVCGKNNVGVTAEVCSTDKDLKVVVLNLSQVVVTSEKPVTVNLKLNCNDEPPTVQDQVQPKVAEVAAVKQAQVDQEVAPVKKAKVPKEVVPPKKEEHAKAAKVLQGVAQVKASANKAQESVNRVKVGAARAQQNVDKAQLGVEKAQRGVASAFVVGEKAQLRVFKADHSIAKAQRRIYKAQSRIYNAQRRADKAQRRVDKAQKRANKAQNRVGYVQGMDYY